MEQLQADNAELQAELQHLAATLRAALAASPDCASGAAAASLGGSVDLSADGVQHLDGFLPAHNHTHLQLGHGHGACHESHSLTASMLSSVDTPPPALEHALDEQADSQGPNGSPAGPAAGLAAPPVYHQPSAVARATLSCSMQHPGSICCTKLSSTVDPSGAACTISLHTTARCGFGRGGCHEVLPLLLLLRAAATPAAAATASGRQGAVRTSGMRHMPLPTNLTAVLAPLLQPGSPAYMRTSTVTGPQPTSILTNPSPAAHPPCRCTADDSTVHRHLEPEELRALAAHALVGAAHSFSQAATADYRKRLGPPQARGAAGLWRLRAQRLEGVTGCSLLCALGVCCCELATPSLQRLLCHAELERVFLPLHCRTWPARTQS